MIILTDARPNIINEGYDYYIANKVSNIKQLKRYQFAGYVQDDKEEPYYTTINLEYPKTSYCDCEYVNKNKICKHMIAIYFSVFKEEALIHGELLYDYYKEYEYRFAEEYDDLF